MLLEANYWFYFLAGERIDVFSSLERLQQLNKTLAGVFDEDIIAFENSLRIYQGREFRQLTPGEWESNGKLWFSRIRTQTLHLVSHWLAQGQMREKESSIFDQFPGEGYGSYPDLEKGLLQAIKILGSRQWQQGEELLFRLAGKASILAHSWYIGLVNLLLGLNSYYGQRRKVTQFFFAAGQAFSKLGCTELAFICKEAETLAGWDPAKVNVTEKTPLQPLFAYIFALGQQEVKRHLLSFNLFNQFQVFYYRKQVNIQKWGRKKAEELILFLLVQPGYQASRDLILEEIFNYQDMQKVKIIIISEPLTGCPG